MQRLRGAGGFGEVSWRRGAGAVGVWEGGMGFGIGIGGILGWVVDGGVYMDARDHGRSFCSFFCFTLYCLAYASLFLKTSVLLICNLANSHTMREGGHLRQRYWGCELGMRTANVLLLGEIKQIVV